MAAITVANMLQRIRWELGDHPWETTGSAASSSSVVAVADGTDWAEGDSGEFADDGDQFLVRSVSTNDLTSVRGYNGTTAAAHAASSRIFKYPRYGYNEIRNAVSAVVQDRLWPWVWKKVGDSITPSTTAVWYDLAADALDLIDVRQLYGTSDTKEGRYGERHDVHQVVLRRNMTTSLVASGVGLRFPGGFYHPTNTVNVDYAAKITTGGTTSYDDLMAGDAVTEAVIYGAVSHLEAALEQKKPRKPRQDRETLRGASMFDSKFRDALARAHQECQTTIPRMRKWSSGAR